MSQFHPVRESDQQQNLRRFAESVSDLAWIAQPDGCIHWYNQRWFTYTGTTAQDMEGWASQSVHHPEHFQAVMKAWQTSIASGQPFDMVSPLRGADGIFRSFLTRTIPFHDDEGNILYWFGTNTNLSRELTALEALRISEDRFRIATEAISNILWTNDAEGKMSGEQPAWAAFTGQTLDEYQGYGWASAVHPDDAQPTIDAWRQNLRNGSRFVFEHRVRRHDGVYRLCIIRALPARNADGSVREWVGIHNDITEERENQGKLQHSVEALHEQQQLVETAQLVSQVGFWRYEPSTGKTFFSTGTRHLLGLPQEGVIPIETALACIVPEDVFEVRAALESAAVSGRYEVEFRTKPSSSGPSRWIRGAAQILNPGTPQTCLIGMNLDITQQKRGAEVLMQTEKLAVAGRLAASIAHEINNPLEAVINLLYLLTESELDDQQRVFAQTMQSELGRIAQIATHTLRFHRQSTRATETFAKDLLKTVLALHAGKIRNASIDLIERYRATIPVTGFEGELRQVLANLIGNAIDAMHGASGPRTLTLRTRCATRIANAEQGVLITIADTGEGMSAETLARIFDAFFTTKLETGTGLGLWVSHEIVVKHRGTLRVRSSQNPARIGTVFQLFLPSSQPNYQPRS